MNTANIYKQIGNKVVKTSGIGCCFYVELLISFNQKQWQRTMSRVKVFCDMYRDCIEIFEIPSKHISYYCRLNRKIKEELEKNKVLTYID